MKTWGKVDSSKKPKQQFYVFLEKITFFLEIVKFYNSWKPCNEWSRLIAGCIGFIVGYVDSTSLKFRVSAYNPDQLIAE